MSYDFKNWRKRYAERSDLTTELVHLTKPRKLEKKDALDVLFEILDSKKLIGSTTSSGFIVGNTPAVCFQDAPLTAVGQNCWFEQTFRNENEWAKLRYVPVGVIIKKKLVFNKGGRPVIYDKKDSAKSYLPEAQWWRIVNFDLGSSDNIVDWSHEREWRLPNQLEFELTDVVLLFANNSQVQEFIKKCDSSNKDYYRQIRGITTMESIIC